MTLSGYFTSKSVFGQQGCRTLTFALARLSCYPVAAGAVALSPPIKTLQASWLLKQGPSECCYATATSTGAFKFNQPNVTQFGIDIVVVND